MAHHASNINVRGRLTQIIILLVMILACMLFSILTHAQRSAKKIRFDSPKYRITVHNSSGKACHILNKKRTSIPKHPLIATSRRTKKALAETSN